MLCSCRCSRSCPDFDLVSLLIALTLLAGLCTCSASHINHGRAKAIIQLATTVARDEKMTECTKDDDCKEIRIDGKQTKCYEQRWNFKTKTAVKPPKGFCKTAGERGDRWAGKDT
ncbi:unnamed protein product [Vitrella brassicaformis CCMP3155]|uniref:Secreted protein n=1 Tax=Vitrella brassicaformis (strain CCMP3155) TaxID=1169540 RepID=A0A0G4FGI8_VITBC|nr:unnamed protein product [Vitrella brassicaformis CCMP3155]|eukprot:CEM11955.1 unnamed protein product [Vitrella brassicaformis CCMP3155]